MNAQMPAGRRLPSQPKSCRHRAVYRSRQSTHGFYAEPALAPPVRLTHPLMLGYQVASTSAAVRAGDRDFVTFAGKSGYTAGALYVESGSRRGTSALAALVQEARRQDVAAIAVPTAADLGRTAALQQLMRDRIAGDASVTVYIMEEYIT